MWWHCGEDHKPWTSCFWTMEITCSSWICCRITRGKFGSLDFARSTGNSFESSWRGSWSSSRNEGCGRHRKPTAATWRIRHGAAGTRGGFGWSEDLPKKCGTTIRGFDCSKTKCEAKANVLWGCLWISRFLWNCQSCCFHCNGAWETVCIGPETLRAYSSETERSKNRLGRHFWWKAGKA